MRDEQRKAEDNVNYGGRQVKLTIFFALRDRQPKRQIIIVKRAWRQIDLTFAGGAFVSGFENVILMLSSGPLRKLEENDKGGAMLTCLGAK